MNNNNGENYDILLTRFLKDVISNFKRFKYVINIFKRNNFMNPVIGYLLLQKNYILCPKIYVMYDSMLFQGHDVITIFKRCY